MAWELTYGVSTLPVYPIPGLLGSPKVTPTQTKPLVSLVRFPRNSPLLSTRAPCGRSHTLAGLAGDHPYELEDSPALLLVASRMQPWTWLVPRLSELLPRAAVTAPGACALRGKCLLPLGEAMPSSEEISPYEGIISSPNLNIWRKHIAMHPLRN